MNSDYFNPNDPQLMVDLQRLSDLGYAIRPSDVPINSLLSVCCQLAERIHILETPDE